MTLDYTTKTDLELARMEESYLRALPHLTDATACMTIRALSAIRAEQERRTKEEIRS